MKTSNLIAIGRLSVLIFSVFLSNMLYAQTGVKIKERVIIAPSIKLIDTDTVTQVKLLRKVGMTQTTNFIPVLDSGNVTITVVSSNTAAQIDLILRSPINQTIISGANGGGSWISPFYPHGTMLDIGILWHWEGESGNEYGAIVTRNSELTYTIAFEDVGIGHDYNDLIINVEMPYVVRQLDHFDVKVFPDTIYSDDYAQVQAIAKDKNGNECEQLDDNTSISISAVPSEDFYYWNQYYSSIYTYGEIKLGNIYISAADNPNIQIREYNITVFAEGASGTGKLIVKKAPCLVMSLSRSKIAPGEKVDITLQQLDLYGNLTDYPSNQIFRIWMNTNNRYGIFHSLSTDVMSRYLYAPQPIEFIATDNLDVDSTVVEIEARAMAGGGGGGAGTIGIWTKDTLGKSGLIMAIRKTKASNIHTVPNEMNIGLSIEKLQSLIDEESTKQVEEKQKQKHANIMKKLISRLMYETVKNPTEKQSSSESINQEAMLTAETAECKPKAWVTIKKKELVLTVMPTKIFQGDTAWVEVKKKLPDGTLESFPADQVIDIWMNTDDSYGKFRSVPTGQEGSEIITQQPFQFIAADNIELDTVIVEAQVWVDDEYIMPNAKVLVLKKGFDKFKILLSQDTLGNSEIADMTVIAADKNGNEVQIDPLKSVNLIFSDLNQYVDFITAAGDYANALINVPYGVLRSGQIKIIARGKQTGPITIAANSRIPSKVNTQSMSTKSEGSTSDYPKTSVVAVLASDATKLGFCDLVLRPAIKVNVVSDEIKPRYPGIILDAESRTNVEIVVTVSGIPFGSSLYTVEIKSSAVEGSGGHSHIGNRPTGRFIDGKYELISLSKASGQIIQTCYQASICGGEEYVSARIFGLTPAIADSHLVVVRVPGLINFANISSDNWRITGNIGPTSYKKCRGTEIHHPDSHYGTYNTITQLQNAIQDFYDWSGSEEGGGKYLALGINDMSLIYGGLFDICSDWLPDHKSHRKGKSVDIDGSATRNGGQGIINLNNLAPDGRSFLDHLTIIVNRKGGQREPEEPIHYEF
jgi:hypothetical protein